MRTGPSWNGPGSLAVDHGGDPKLLVGISALPKSGYRRGLVLWARARSAPIQRKQLTRRQDRPCQYSHAAEKAPAVPLRVPSHGPAPFSLYLRATTAMQLISTSDSPGNPANATVVRAGPP